MPRRVAVSCGFPNPAYFSALFRRRFGRFCRRGFGHRNFRSRGFRYGCFRYLNSCFGSLRLRDFAGLRFSGVRRSRGGDGSRRGFRGRGSFFRLVRAVQHFRIRLVVGRANRIYSDFLQEPQLAAEGRSVPFRTDRSEVVMQANASEFDLLSVDEKAIRRRFYLRQTLAPVGTGENGRLRIVRIKLV